MTSTQEVDVVAIRRDRALVQEALDCRTRSTLLPGARHGPVGIFDGIIDCTMRWFASTFAGNSVLSTLPRETGSLPSIVNVMKWF